MKRMELLGIPAGSSSNANAEAQRRRLLFLSQQQVMERRKMQGGWHLPTLFQPWRQLSKNFEGSASLEEEGLPSLFYAPGKILPA